SRRAFLTFLAASPVLAAVGFERSTLARMFDGTGRDSSAALATVHQAAQDASLITSAAEALDVFDFEPVAKKNIPVAHWGYLMTGSDDDATIRANREGFNRYALRVRRLIDVSKIDPSIDMLGVHWATPIVLCLVG